jgi:hypothetical protein
MKRKTIPTLFTGALMLGVSPAMHAQAVDAATLRCDPYTIIWQIDGKRAGHGNSSGWSFKDCDIPLAAGTHMLQVCYDASSQSMNTVTELRCDQPKDISFDAAAGRSYRLKATMGPGWKAWVEDVTEAEAGYSYVPRPKKPPPANKAERKSTLILRVSPQHVIPRFHRGRLLGPWIVPSRTELKGENTGIAKAAPDGFVVVEADAGDDITITHVRLLEGSVFMPKHFFGCDDYQARVFEDITGGKVLYLGHMTLDGTDSAQKVTWTEDFDAARAYVDTHFPGLAGRLEKTSFTTRRLPVGCALYPGVLLNAP